MTPEQTPHAMTLNEAKERIARLESELAKKQTPSPAPHAKEESVKHEKPAPKHKK